MRSAVAISRHLDAERACVDATEQAMRLAGKEGAPDLLWCVTVAHSLEDTERGLAMAQKRSGAREAVACTAGGVLASTGGHQVEREPAAGVMVLYGDPGLQAWSGRTRRPAWKDRPMFVLVDNDGSPTQQLRMLQEAWDPQRVAGGAAAGVDMDAGVIHHGVGMVDHVAVAPGAPVVEVAVAQGTAPLGDVMVVTRSDGNLVLELDGRPALTRVLDMLPVKDRQEPARSLGRCLIGLQPGGPNADAFKLGQYAVRPLMGMAPDVGALAIGENLRQGDAFTLLRRDGAAAEKAMVQTLMQVKQRLQGAVPVGALYFSCTGRGSAMFGDAGTEVALLQRHFGKVPVLGMNSAFEMGPMPGGPPSIHMFSGVLMVLAEGN